MFRRFGNGMFPGTLPDPRRSQPQNSGSVTSISREGPCTAEFHAGMLLLTTGQPIPSAGKASAGHPSCLPQPRGNFPVEQLWILAKVATATGISVEAARDVPPTATSSFESRTRLLRGHILHKSASTDSSRPGLVPPCYSQLRPPPTQDLDRLHTRMSHKPQDAAPQLPGSLSQIPRMSVWCFPALHGLELLARPERARRSRYPTVDVLGGLEKSRSTGGLWPGPVSG